MDFRIADTLTGSMARLTNDEQKLVKLERAKDKNFWSVRVGRDIRLIVHKTAASLLVCYAGHHDDASSRAMPINRDVGHRLPIWQQSRFEPYAK